MHIRLPVDFQSLPEYRTFQAHLLQQAGRLASEPNNGSPLHVDSAAMFIFMRLWVDLAYQAEVSKPFGLLSSGAIPLFLAGLGKEMERFKPLDMLAAARMLEKREAGYFCERFARLNEHLNPDFKSAQVKGAEHSAHARRRKQVAHEAMQQAFMLPPEKFVRRDGRVLGGSEINRVIIIVKSIDNCLGLPQRPSSQYTEGLIADAAELLDKYSAEQMEQAYYWIIDHREHPALPKTTEQILQNFASLATLVKHGAQTI